jgi:hypothetical protein
MSACERSRVKLDVLSTSNEFVTVRCIIIDFCTSATAARGPFRVKMRLSACGMPRLTAGMH